MSSPIQTSQSSPSIPIGFKLVTFIDRINYFSDKFISYYKQIFNPEEFFFIINWRDLEEIKAYLLDHGFSEKSFHVNMTRTNFGYGEQVSQQNSIKREFISRGYIVVYADIDELIYHPDFKSYVLNSPKQLFCSKGIQIVQAPGEAYLDVTKPIVDQRLMGQYDDYYYAKVCILKKDFTWTGGRHNKEGVKPDENIWLLDIGKVCKHLMLENNKKTTELYGGVFPRYTYKTMPEVEKEYKNYLKGIAPIPEIVKNNRVI